jgi:type VI secretion system secreted protein VgrG
MSLNLSFSFPTSPAATTLVAAGFKVRRYQLRESLSALFELTIEVLASDPAVDMAAVVGQPVAVRFDDEPFLKELRGVVRHAAQLTAVPSGDSTYSWTIVPPLWLTTQRRDTRIFQDVTVAEILALVLGDPGYAGRIPQAVEQLTGSETMREYCVQYGETDHDFLFRLLAEDGNASFFDHANGSAFTLIANTSKAIDLVGAAVPFSDPSNLNPIVAKDPTAPRISAVTFAAALTTSAATIRSWDFERPALVLDEKSAIPAARLLPNEAALEAYTFEPGVIDRSPAAGQRAAERLQSLRTGARSLVCEASFTLPPGSRFTLVDHPRADLNIDLLVVEAVSIVEFGGASTRTLTCIDRRELYIPAQRPKPRIHGTQSAIVVGAPGEEIDVDKFGRVQVEFHWDRRALHTGGTSRRVRVAQGWAGAAFGFVMLPRVNEEVLVVYLDGDPDEPIIVGRVHNAIVTSPLNLPAEKTVSVWRSRSSPGGEGFNEIRMDDLAGAEKFSLHAQLDFRSVTERNAETVVGVDQSLKVGGGQRTVIGGTQRTGVIGDLETRAKSIELHGTAYFQAQTDGDLYLDAGGNQEVKAGCNYHIRSNSTYVESQDVVQIAAPTIHLFGGKEIHLQVGGSSIHITEGEVRIVSPIINLNP